MRLKQGSEFASDSDSFGDYLAVRLFSVSMSASADQLLTESEHTVTAPHLMRTACQALRILGSSGCREPHLLRNTKVNGHTICPPSL